MATRCIGKVFFRRNNTFTDNTFTSRNLMADTIINWQDKPRQEGWYATLLSWELVEGVFAGANYWDGAYWDSYEPIFECAGPFESKNVAELWAYENKPEN